MTHEEQKAELLAIVEDVRKEVELLELYYHILEKTILELQCSPIWDLERDIRVKTSAVIRFEQILKGTYAPHLVNQYRTTSPAKEEKTVSL